MIRQGRASIVDLLGGYISFRSLCPMDARLRPANGTQPAAGRDGKRQPVPRKGSKDHADTVARMLRQAHRLAHGGHSRAPSKLLYLGDTMESDARAFGHLCQVTGWSGHAIIINENRRPPQIGHHNVPGGIVHFANRWSTLPDLVSDIQNSGFAPDSQTLVVVDIDKTLIGARGRNSAAIDRVRRQAALDVANSLTEDSLDPGPFQKCLDELAQPDFHTLTEDNQDAVVYVALIAALGVLPLRELQCRQDLVSEGFASFLQEVGRRKHHLASGMRRLHDEISYQVAQGNPTPFLAFRQAEYRATYRALTCIPSAASPAETLGAGIVMTGEVWSTVRAYQEHGAVAFGLSDKPDEACFPPEDASDAETLSLCHVPLTILGGER